MGGGNGAAGSVEEAKGGMAATMNAMGVAVRAPPLDQPRNRIFNAGAAAMSEAELLALLLGTGQRGSTALQTAEALLARFDGLGGLARAHITDLRDENGVGVAKASLIVGALELGRRSVGPRAERPRTQRCPPSGSCAASRLRCAPCRCCCSTPRCSGRSCFAASTSTGR